MHLVYSAKKVGESISFIQLIWGTVLLNYPFSILMSHCFHTIFVSLPWALHNHHSWVKSLTVPPNLTTCKGVCGMPSGETSFCGLSFEGSSKMLLSYAVLNSPMLQYILIHRLFNRLLLLHCCPKANLGFCRIETCLRFSPPCAPWQLGSSSCDSKLAKCKETDVWMVYLQHKCQS